MKQSKLDLLFQALKSEQKIAKPGVTLILFLAILFKLQFLAIVALILALLLFYPDLGSLLRQYAKAIKWGDKQVEFREPVDQAEPIKERDPRDKTTVPNEAMMAFDKGNQLLSSERFEESIREFDQAVKADPNFSNAYLNLGAAYLSLWHRTKQPEHLAKSIENSKRALEIAPEGYRSRINLAVAYSKIREHEEDALKLFEEADRKGDLQDPFTWGKVKLFKGQMILTLSERETEGQYQKRLPDAEYSVLRSIELFQETGRILAYLEWLGKADSVLELIRKKMKSTA